MYKWIFKDHQSLKNKNNLNSNSKTMKMYLYKSKGLLFKNK